MTRLISALAVTLILASCGASGSPVRPTESAISISGETNIGVVGGPGGSRLYNGTNLAVNFGI